MSTPRSARPALVLGWIALIGLVFGLGGWATHASLTGAVIVPGAVSVAENRQVVQHPEGGVITRLMVHEGEEVRAGQVLARLDDSVPASEKAIVDTRYWELVARHARLLAERDGRAAPRFPPMLTVAARRDPAIAAMVTGQQRLFAARRTTLEQELAQLAERQAQIGAQLEGVSAQRAALTRQRALVDEELGAQRALLAKKLTEATRVLALQREAARLAGSLGALAAARAEAEGKRIELGIARTRLVAQRREQAIAELRDLDNRLAELAERRAALAARLARLEIRAPVAGVVMGLTLTTRGAVLKPAEPLLSIVPGHRPLVVTVEISPHHVDEVRAGDPVRLRLSGIGGRAAPELSGSLTRVSADTFDDRRTGRSYYRAEIALAPDELAQFGSRLRPGMPVEAFIITGRQSPATYLLQPFVDYFAHALREG